MLEEEIALLQARLRELEHPEETGPSAVTLSSTTVWNDPVDDVGDLDMIDHSPVYSLTSRSSLGAHFHILSSPFMYADLVNQLRPSRQVA